MNFISDALNRYAEHHTSPESEALQYCVRQTHLQTLQPRMLSGHLQGRFLSLISNLMQPTRILEIGMFTGYSAICLAEGLRENGKLIAIEVNDEVIPIAKQCISKAGLDNKIDIIHGDALKTISTLAETFDIVFIDAAKREYAAYFDAVIDKVRIGGLIIADNILWSGKVLDAVFDTDTRAIDVFNKKMVSDVRLETVLLPLRDGLIMSRKK